MIMGELVQSARHRDRGSTDGMAPESRWQGQVNTLTLFRGFFETAISVYSYSALLPWPGFGTTRSFTCTTEISEPAIHMDVDWTSLAARIGMAKYLVWIFVHDGDPR